jgi:hypothetical protein
LRLLAGGDKCDAVQTQSLKRREQGDGVFVGSVELGGHGASEWKPIIVAVLCAAWLNQGDTRLLGLVK